MEETQYRKWDVAIKIVGGVFALVAFVWTIQQHFLTKRQEIAFEAWKRKVETLGRLCEASAVVAITSTSSTDRDKWGPLHDEFWKQYYGEFQMTTLPGSPVRTAAYNFQDLVSKMEPPHDQKRLSTRFEADQLLELLKILAAKCGEEVRRGQP